MNNAYSNILTSTINHILSIGIIQPTFSGIFYERLSYNFSKKEIFACG